MWRVPFAWPASTNAASRGPLSTSREQATAWLARLARGMRDHGQTVFLVEQLQPSWLQSRWSIVFYGVATRLGDGVVAAFAVLSILVAVDGSGRDSIDALLRDSRIYFLSMVVPAAVGAAAATVAVLCLDLFRLDQRPQHSSSSAAVSPPSKGWRWARLIDPVVAVVISHGLLVCLASASSSPNTGLDAVFFCGPALVVGLLRRRADWGTVRDGRGDITPVETLTWSWSGFLKGLLAGLGFGFALLIASYSILLLLSRLDAAIFLAVVGIGGAALSCGLLVIVMTLRSAFRVGVLEIRARPNAGIRSSLLNGIRVAWCTGWLTVFGYLAAFYFLRYGDLAVEGLLLAAMFGLGAALLIGHWYGGADVLRHYTLRFLLARGGRLPWRLGPFLDRAATDLQILQRVGGGYIYLHRYLLEYFADLDPAGVKPPNDEARTADA